MEMLTGDTWTRPRLSLLPGPVKAQFQCSQAGSLLQRAKLFKCICAAVLDLLQCDRPARWHAGAGNKSHMKNGKDLVYVP